MLMYTLWQCGLLSFQQRDAKLDIFLAKNNMLKGTTNFGMIDGSRKGLSKIGKDVLKQERKF